MKQWAMFQSYPSSYSGGICGFWGGTGCLRAFPVPAGGLPLCMGPDNQVAAVALNSPCWAFPPSKGPQCPVLCHIPATGWGYEAPSSAQELYQWHRESCPAVLCQRVKAAGFLQSITKAFLFASPYGHGKISPLNPHAWGGVSKADGLSLSCCCCWYGGSVVRRVRRRQCDFWEVWDQLACHSGHIVCGHSLPCSARSVMFYHASPELAHCGEIEACFPLLNSLWFFNDFQHPPGSSSNMYLNQTISYLFVVLFLLHQFCSMALPFQPPVLLCLPRVPVTVARDSSETIGGTAVCGQQTCRKEDQGVCELQICWITNCISHVKHKDLNSLLSIFLLLIQEME